MLLKRNVFVFADATQFEVIKKSESFLNFIYWLNNEVTITNEEACLLKEYVNGQHAVKVEKTNVLGYHHFSTSLTSSMDKENFFEVNQDEFTINLPSLGYQFTVQLQMPKLQVIDVNAGKEHYTKVVAST